MAAQQVAIDSELLFELELFPVPFVGEPGVRQDVNAAIRYLLDAYRGGECKGAAEIDAAAEARGTPDSERDWSGSGISG